MLRPRAFVQLTGLALGVVLFVACDRSATAPELRSERAPVTPATDIPAAVAPDFAGTQAFVPVDRGRIDVAARSGYQVDSTSQASRRGRSKYSVIIF